MHGTTPTQRPPETIENYFLRNGSTQTLNFPAMKNWGLWTVEDLTKIYPSLPKNLQPGQEGAITESIDCYVQQPKLQMIWKIFHSRYRLSHLQLLSQMKDLEGLDAFNLYKTFPSYREEEAGNSIEAKLDDDHLLKIFQCVENPYLLALVSKRFQSVFSDPRTINHLRGKLCGELNISLTEMQWIVSNAENPFPLLRKQQVECAEMIELPSKGLSFQKLHEEINKKLKTPAASEDSSDLMQIDVDVNKYATDSISSKNNYFLYLLINLDSFENIDPENYKVCINYCMNKPSPKIIEKLIKYYPTHFPNCIESILRVCASDKDQLETLKVILDAYKTATSYSYYVNYARSIAIEKNFTDSIEYLSILNGKNLQKKAENWLKKIQNVPTNSHPQNDIEDLAKILMSAEIKSLDKSFITQSLFIVVMANRADAVRSVFVNRPEVVDELPMEEFLKFFTFAMEWDSTELFFLTVSKFLSKAPAPANQTVKRMFPLVHQTLCPNIVAAFRNNQLDNGTLSADECTQRVLSLAKLN